MQGKLLLPVLFYERADSLPLLTLQQSVTDKKEPFTPDTPPAAGCPWQHFPFRRSSPASLGSPVPAAPG